MICHRLIILTGGSNLGLIGSLLRSYAFKRHLNDGGVGFTSCLKI